VRYQFVSATPAGVLLQRLDGTLIAEQIEHKAIPDMLRRRHPQTGTPRARRTR
jgi:hypothetical protein